jgi:hypothetical protein
VRTLPLLLRLVCFSLLLLPTAIAAQNSDPQLIEDGTHEGYLFANQIAEFIFQGNAGESVTISATKTSGSADLQLELYLPDETLYFVDDDSGGRLNPLISDLPLSTTGEYRIVVNRCRICDSDSSASFDLNLNREVLGLGAEDDKSELITAGDYDGILLSNQTAEYAFMASDDDRLTIGVIRTSGTADLLLEIYSPDGNLLFSDDDSGGSFNPLISSLPIQVAGQYRIVVTRCSICDSAASAGFNLTLAGNTGDPSIEPAVESAATPTQSPTSLTQNTSDCDLVEYRDSLIASMDSVEAGNIAGVLAEMVSLSRIIHSTRARCMGLSFNSEQHGMRPVIGPIEFADGIYRSTLTTDGFININLIPISGDCDLGFSVWLFSILSSEAGIASQGASKTLTSRSCIAMLEFERIDRPWTLEFELITD